MTQQEIGDTFQQETKYQRGRLPRGRLDWVGKPATYKRYPSAPKIPLSPPQTEGGALLWDVLRQRRSVRRFQGGPLREAALSQLLWGRRGSPGATGAWGCAPPPGRSALSGGDLSGGSRCRGN